MAVRRCTPCMSKSLKEMIREFTDDADTLRQIDSIPVCPRGEILELCGGKSGGRKRSAYQEFISQCMSKKPIKGKPFGTAAQYMKECAAEYRKERR